MIGWSAVALADSAAPCQATLLLVGASKGAGASVFIRPPHPSSTSVRSLLSARAGDVVVCQASRPAPTRLIALGVDDFGIGEPAHWMSIGGDLLDAMILSRIDSVRLPEGSDFGDAPRLEAFLLGILLHGFRLREPEHVPKQVLVAPSDSPLARKVAAQAQVLNRVRAWVAAPANRLTPTVWCDQARELFEARGARVRVLGPAELEQLGAEALLTVGRGSEAGSRLLVVEWRGTPSREGWDAACIGKGLTFDSGGLNLKPRPTIAKMKVDMAGGAGVLGALELAIERRSAANIVALVPIAENVVDARSMRPGDVVSSLSRISIEIADTDAEGRLVLADAISYAIRTYSPTFVVDAATLTTAIMEVLHEEFAGLYTNDDELAAGLTAAGEQTGERVWRLPLHRDHDYLIESEIADLSNLGKAGYFGRGEGSPTAGAKFLQRFAQGARWAHIDMCGVAWAARRRAQSGSGPTGFGARLLDQWLQLIEAAW